MTIIKMRAHENRRDRRREINLTLEYDGHDFPIADCSLGGIVIEGGCETFEPETDVTASLKSPADEMLACQDIALRVVRNDPRTQRVAFHFSGLNNDCFNALERHLTGRAGR